MNKDNIWSNISRNLAGEKSVESDKELERWIEKKTINKEIYSRLKQIWEAEGQEKGDYENLFYSILRRIRVHENKPPKPIYMRPLFRAAAILLFLVATNVFVLWQSQKASKLDQMVYQEIVVPRGNRMNVILPDSTSIWLNNESKLRYRSNFNSTNREVELIGEAFFDVRHDAKHPFIVKVGNEQIKVLGTKFSVNAYPEDNVIETSLITGSVQFSTTEKVKGKSTFLLKPGYSLLYNKVKNNVTTEKIQNSYFEYWEKGVYAFKDEKFEDLALKIKRIFNVEVVFEDEFLKNKTYTGTIHINDNVFLFMEAIRRTSVEPIEYRFDKNIIYASIKSN